MDDLIVEVINITTGASVVFPLVVDASPNDPTLTASECKGSVNNSSHLPQLLQFSPPHTTNNIPKPSRKTIFTGL